MTFQGAPGPLSPSGKMPILTYPEGLDVFSTSVAMKALVGLHIYLSLRCMTMRYLLKSYVVAHYIYSNYIKFVRFLPNSEIRKIQHFFFDLNSYMWHTFSRLVKNGSTVAQW